MSVILIVGELTIDQVLVVEKIVLDSVQVVGRIVSHVVNVIHELVGGALILHFKGVDEGGGPVVGMLT
jgi:hypothetical protein